MSISEEIAEMLILIREKLENIDIASLPGVTIDTANVCVKLPISTTAIYFLRGEKDGLLYIGRATDLKSRWTLNYYVGPIPLEIMWDQVHAKLRDALDLGDVTLHWLEVRRDHLATVESLLLQIHRPPWNSQRG